MARDEAAARAPRQSSPARTLAIFFLALIVIVGLAVLIIWLAIKPKKLVYTVEKGTIHGFNLTHAQLNATFDFAIRAHNPNTKVAVYYDKVEAFVSYDDEKVGFGSLSPFFQPRRNVTHLELRLAAQNVTLYENAERDLRLEKSAGEMELDLHLKARIRFKVGKWKSRHYHMKILCSPAMARFSSSKPFQATRCDVDV
ncbi:uncharacterized protein At1g08160 [Diospyros lotus]|uniref:uncharacterized protein At1g08160 n=1 Tax=Diospyros lotus TaxID=55363 RepID=UPI0022505245|nr:uncharacterized protein At1g08160 [Diospyros lotus]